MLRYSTKNQGGFTLIELLVVVAIIGLLAAIIVPNVTKYIESGSNAAAETESHLIQNAVVTVMADAKIATLQGTATITIVCTGDGTYSVTTISATHPKLVEADLTAISKDSDIKITIGEKDYLASDYIMGGLSGIKGVYAVGSDGTILQKSYTP